jgi:hypothetical protein
MFSFSLKNKTENVSKTQLSSKKLGTPSTSSHSTDKTCLMVLTNCKLYMYIYGISTSLQFFKQFFFLFRFNVEGRRIVDMGYVLCGNTIGRIS